MITLFRKWQNKRHHIQQISHLDERLLRDIGITIADVHDMHKKPFWKY